MYEDIVATSQVLVGNKCDMDESKRAVPYSKGQALADELGIPFFETSAKNNINVTEVRLPRHASLQPAVPFHVAAMPPPTSCAQACVTLQT